MNDTYTDETAEYRADHIELDELERITAETDFYKEVLKKLMSRGSKVIIGPRGVGKTHQMRIAYKKCLSEKKRPFPVYITFSKYLRLEPLKSSSAIAIQYFHCWVLSKILLSTKDAYQTITNESLNGNIENSDLTWEKLERFCDQIEKQQQQEWHEALLEEISVRFVSEYIEQFMGISGRNHCILLCDDAALVLAQDYMIEFMDVFRSLKSTKVSPKASVYPNTEFGPRFHLGHDAEPVPCWPSILDSEYEGLFDDVYRKRFHAEISEDVKKCFMYASFGVPRTFINLVNHFNRSNGSAQQRVNEVINEQSSLIIKEYRSQESKQPQFKNYIRVGESLFNKVVKELVINNKTSLSKGQTQFIFGIRKDYDTDAKLIKNTKICVRLLEETGMLQKTTPVKHGAGREYDRYVPHFTILLASGAFQIGRSGYISTFSESINYERQKHPLRRNSFSEFDHDNELIDVTLDLPNCSNCNEPRNSENQRFCMFCGSELINKSTFERLVESTIESLPITTWLKNKITDDTVIETIGDVVLSTNPGQELMKARGIGKVKATKVIYEAEAWMDEYLS